MSRDFLKARNHYIRTMKDQPTESFAMSFGCADPDLYPAITASGMEPTPRMDIKLKGVHMYPEVLKPSVHIDDKIFFGGKPLGDYGKWISIPFNNDDKCNQNLDQLLKTVQKEINGENE